MDVVGHKTICPYLYFLLPTIFLEQIKIVSIVFITKKDILSAIAALGNMMRISGQKAGGVRSISRA